MTRDREFLAAYKAFVRGGDDRALERLETLFKEGATTAAFPDRDGDANSRPEGGDYFNFAEAVQDFVEDDVAPKDLRKFVRAAELVVSAGNAFRTNNTNGSQLSVRPAGVILIMYLVDPRGWRGNPKPQSREKADAAFEILKIMTEHGYDLLNPEEYALWAFAHHLRAQDAPDGPDFIEKQHAFLHLAVEQGLGDSCPAAEDFVGPALGVLEQILRHRRMDLLHPILARLEGNVELQAGLSTRGLNIFLTSPERRKTLIELARQYSFIKNWLLSPPVLFALLTQREMSLLRQLRRFDRRKFQDARNERGDTLLHQLCRLKGLTTGAARFLFSCRVDRNAKNSAGETPLDVARTHGNKELAALLLGGVRGGTDAEKRSRGGFQGSRDPRL